ncbi:hypothetical protein ABFS82_06G204900 [Erythranthe guttata]|uniref:uncharacterized protein LOC105955431 n=1 Tax=Erythranthe guttata TaxID=4155 RepID=UPI00064DAE94|nr:PREDICTED: uncharacterized protein LOC105955431 [Erythranthe guttata]|eukprot:XP_012834606.1 PREDICTED: uncharacterized protein LOC105955431 [Erythranthe guttata]
MESGGEDQVDNYDEKQVVPPPPPTFPNPLINFATKLLSLQADIFLSPFDFFFHSEPKDHHFHFQPSAPPPSSTAARLLLGRRIAMGLLAAAYVCVLLMLVMVVAAVLGFGLVGAWAEEPIYVRESLHFDYTNPHPTSLFSFDPYNYNYNYQGVPVGHTLYVSLLLLMPESDYNRDLGIFQLSAELLSVGGELVAKSSHPCMLRFRSWPVRLTRTFLMGVPLLLGMTTETQRLTFPILKHKETSYPRTADVRITLIPRAGTSSLPQFYDAQVLIRSRPPWTKELVYKWKWTFSVWTTMQIFIFLVITLVFFLKPLIFPVMAFPFGKLEQDDSYSSAVDSDQEALGTRRDEREVSESLRRWQRSRSKRKAALLHRVVPPETSGGSSASSMTVTQGLDFEEGSGDSESVCYR